MATIKNQDEQRKALKNINSSIKDLEATNEFLKQHNASGKYSISFTADDGKKYSAEIQTESKETIVNLVMAYKASEKKRISEMADAYGIALDPQDIEILDFTV